MEIRWRKAAAEERHCTGGACSLEIAYKGVRCPGVASIPPVGHCCKGSEAGATKWGPGAEQANEGRGVHGAEMQIKVQTFEVGRAVPQTAAICRSLVVMRRVPSSSPRIHQTRSQTWLAVATSRQPPNLRRPQEAELAMVIA
jgi:hypothetical protein